MKFPRPRSVSATFRGSESPSIFSTERSRGCVGVPPAACEAAAARRTMSNAGVLEPVRASTITYSGPSAPSRRYQKTSPPEIQRGATTALRTFPRRVRIQHSGGPIVVGSGQARRSGGRARGGLGARRSVAGRQDRPVGRRRYGHRYADPNSNKQERSVDTCRADDHLASPKLCVSSSLARSIVALLVVARSA